MKESDDQYMATKRRFPEPNQNRVDVFDEDYRCDAWDRPDLYDQSPLTFKTQPNGPTEDQTENAHNKQPTSQPSNAHNEQPTSQPSKEDTNGSNRKSTFPDDFPASLNSIKEYITEKEEDVCIPLH